ncbi:hypothetical protein EXIGLDRAFT_835603 [Exidia glandulosa HHB12029]|uniref:Uncharacterized protein n=1 Tax=Exidia glandulosa HHB12029 TaxID=1314781 RepID=A0A165IKB3_EXIGL|nr:hypothetical protein EXIGLDRAFT_835603 [Exidia glandulosa HHB12029]
MSSAPKTRKSSTPTQPTTTQPSSNPNVDYAAVFNASAAATSSTYASDLGHVWGSAPSAGVQASTSALTAAPVNRQGGTARPVTAAQLFNNATNASGASATTADLTHFWGTGAAKRNT